MDKREKLEMLQNLSERDLTRRFLIPLFESEEMGCMNVRYTHRKLEFGRDIVYNKKDEYGIRIYTGVQVKKMRITSKDIPRIGSQISEAFGVPFTDLSDGKDKNLDRFVILTSNEFLEEAKDSLWASLRGARLDKFVTCIDGNQLVTLLEKHMPSAFWDEYDYFAKYFNAMKEDFEKIKDISAIGQKEPVSLENLFVSLRVLEKDKERRIPIKSGPEIIEKGAEKKEVDSPTKEEEVELPKKKVEVPARTAVVIDAIRAIKDHSRIVIVGVPGSGKTTMLKYLALELCKENLEKQERANIPIFITLREFSESGKDLRSYIDEQFERYRFPKAKDLVEKDLRDGKCRILLDGFDELATKERQKEIAELISGFMEKYPRCKIATTSRIAGYDDELKGFTKFELMQFDDNQIERFIDNWFGKQNPEKAKSMFEAIRENEQIKAIARNPLMIAIIAIIYEEDRELPQKRVDLYNRCVEVLLSKWDVQKRLKNVYSSDKKEFILKKLAFYGHINNKRILTEDEVIREMLRYFPQIQLEEKDAEPFLGEIWKRSYLLRQISMNSYDFLHLSFQEYFTAIELREREDGMSFIVDHLLEPWWEEPALLFAGISRDATALIRRIEEEVPEDIFFSNLTFFGKCVADAEFTQPNLKQKIVDDIWSVYDSTKFSSLKEKLIRVLALIKPDDIIDELMEDLSDADDETRERAARALGDIAPEKAIGPLILSLRNDGVSTVRGMAAQALGDISSEKAIRPLIEALRTDSVSSVRKKAAQALGKIGTRKAIDPLVEVVKTDKAGDVRSIAAYELGNIGTEKAIHQLIYVLRTERYGSARLAAIRALGSIGSEKAIEYLIFALENDLAVSIRASSAETLGRIGSEKAIEPLVAALRSDDDLSVQVAAAQALGFMGTQSAIDTLISAYRTAKSSIVRYDVLRALGSVGDQEAFEMLVQTLKTDKGSYPRRIAANALGASGTRRAIDPLVEVLRTDKDHEVRRVAANALGRIGTDKVIDPLLKVLELDMDGGVRLAAARELGSIGDERVVESLLNVLEGKGPWVSTELKDEVYVALEKVSRRFKKRIVKESSYNFL